MLNGEILKNAIISGANNINSQKSTINDMNIFPVPDGDTGTNMSMTISAAVKGLENSDSCSVAEVANTIASSMLRGARGNSGVILSLLFRGISKGLEGKTEADGVDIAKALGLGVDSAYGAVMNPTEGTMLTVARVAYESALKATETTKDPVKIWEVACKGADEALETTPELLPVLKRAGVVDAGGKGVCVIFEGMLSYIKDGVTMEYKEVEKDASDAAKEDFFTSAAAEFDQEITFTYCTEFIVEKDKEKSTDSNDLRMFLETIGDSVVLVDDDEIIKVHVHTEQPGDALSKALEYGQLLTIKIENMKEQHKQAKEKAGKKQEIEEKFEFTVPTEDVGFIAISAGEGLKKLFLDLGCNHVVSGGQSMNPSTEAIYEAILATPAKTVFVLPNNKNIILAAEQSAAMVEDREVIIIPTRTIPQGLSAMLFFDPELTPNANKEAMLENAKGVSTGLVTFAARDSEFGNRKIKEGEIIALEDGKLTISEKTPEKAVYKLARNMIKKDSSFVTIIYGDNISAEDAQEAAKKITEKYGSHVDITLIDGGQPIYYFMLSVE